MAEDAIEAKLASRGLLPVGKDTDQVSTVSTSEDVNILTVDLPFVLGVLFKHVQPIELSQSKDFFQVFKTPLDSTSQKSLEPEVPFK